MRLLLFVPVLVISVSCSNGDGQSKMVKKESTMPVETRPPNSTYRPAFPGQTRIAGTHTQEAWEGRVLTSALQHPWGLAVLPDGRLLITEKGGNLRIATMDGITGGPITGMPAVNSDGQGGLLDVALDPAFAQNRMIYCTFSEKRADGNLTAVAKGRLSGDEKQVENVSVIYRAFPAYDGVLHYGGRLAFDRQGYLFVSTGERSDLETRPQAQWLNSALGKVLRITTDGKSAPGNPFAGQAKALPEIWSYGHRNVQGLAIHPGTGDLWESEFGPMGGDELNRIEPGKNYGWPIITYGLEYSGEKVGAGITQKAGLEQPVYYWDPVLSPSGIAIYSGAVMTEWKYNVFLCGLNSNHIARLVLQNNTVIGEERLLEKEGQRFRAIKEGNDGALYVITDEGRLYRIGKKE